MWDNKKKKNTLESRNTVFHLLMFAEKFCGQSATILWLILVLIMVFILINKPNSYT